MSASAVSWVGQESEADCVAASLAMALAISLAEAKAMFRHPHDDGSFSPIERNNILAEHGWAQCDIGRQLNDGSHRDKYPIGPFADLHIVTVKVSEGSSWWHSIIMLADGTVLDPLTPEARSLADYFKIGEIRGLMRCRSVPGEIP